MTDALPDDLVDALRATTRRVLPGAELIDPSVMEGGHSGITVKAQLLLQDVEPTDVVIKVAPLGSAPVGRHDVLRQAAVLSVLAEHHAIRVPRVLFTSDGTPNLYAMSLLPGDASEPVLDDSKLAPTEVAANAHSAARMLAALHRTPLEAEVLKAEQPLDLEQELIRWTKLMNAVPEDLRPNADALRQVLIETMPEAIPATLLHGDYRIGNTLCLGGEVQGVIDWEIWSVGDPRIDLGWFRLFCDESNFPGSSYPAPGMPTVQELTATYVQAGGDAFTHLAWFDGLASYKMAAVMGYNLRRHREGRHIDPYQEKLPPTIRHLVDGSLERLSGTAGRA